LERIIEEIIFVEIMGEILESIGAIWGELGRIGVNWKDYWKDYWRDYWGAIGERVLEKISGERLLERY
jgi:hypothetical protein